jgi:eukaryotic-like serine/threonine-protein kinase
MTPTRWQEIERLYHAVLERPPADQAAYLAEVCMGDPELRLEVQSLLAQDASKIGALDRPAWAGFVSWSNGSMTPIAPGTQLGPYKIEGLLGEGGMGRVYRAVDTRLGRKVALKTCREQFSAQFKREARAISALNHPNICTLHDIGPNYLVMELLEGQTLAERLKQGALPMESVLRHGAQIAAALAEAHGEGIIHRDLKPGNIMLTKNGAKVLDFGLARLLRLPAEFSSETRETDTQTLPGTIMGTLNYMSPEQARGEIADARTDLWSLGVVLYETLACKRPFEGSSQTDILAAIIARDPAPLRSINRAVPAGLADLVEGLLVKDRDQRLSSAAEVAQELRQFSKTAAGKPARMRRRQWIAAAVLALVAVGAASGWFLYRWSKRQWARYEAIPLAHTFADQGDYLGAYRLALDVARYIPKDPELGHLWTDVSQLLSVRSEPLGAEVAWKPYADLKAPWQTLGRTPLDKIRIPAGPIRIQASLAGYESVQAAVDRGASMGNEPSSTYDFRLDRVGAASNMVGLPAQPAASSPFRQSKSMAAFEIGRFEVTNREFKEFINRGGYRNRAYWKIPFVKDGRTLSWEGATALLVDPTGRPGPSTWEAGTYPPGQDNYPVSGVSWYEAAAYAEFAGKSLPTVAHWLRASNLDAVAADYRFMIPLSNLQSGHSQPVGASGAVNTWGLYDVAGNVREWCWNETGGRRAVLGGSWADQVHDTRTIDNAPAFDRSAINGFRCARYTDAKQAFEEFGGPVSPETRPDYHKLKPVSDQVFEVYKALYAYDKKPPHPVVESVDESSDLWRREKVRFQAPYGNEQEIAYLFLPKQGKPPFQCVVYMGDGGTLRRGSGETIQPEHWVLRSGRAIIYPMYKGTLDRYVPIARDPVARRDMAINWRKDLGSTIDYLETRPDIDSAKLAYMGHSMGTRFSPTILATESRIKAAVLFAGGTETPGALPEADPVNFLPRVKIPVLLVAGLYDPEYPVESAQNPMIYMLGTPPKDKRHVILPVGHAILVPEVRATVVREGLDWLDRYLGRP